MSNKDRVALSLKQERRYPWDGSTRITLDTQSPAKFALMLRVPGWARGQVMPGDLYRPTDSAKPDFSLMLNGKPLRPAMEKAPHRARWRAAAQAHDRVHQQGDVFLRQRHGGGQLSGEESADRGAENVSALTRRQRRYRRDLRSGGAGGLGGRVGPIPAAAAAIRRPGVGEYDFAKPEKISSSGVYWKDDKQFCILPKGWRLVYKDGGEWKPVRNLSPYGAVGDRYNKVTFEPVTTSALRLEIQLQPKTYKTGKLGPPDGNYLSEDLTWFEGGVIEWTVER